MQQSTETLVAQAIETINEAVAGAGELGVPAGSLYAIFMGMGWNLQQFEKMMAMVVAVGKVEKRGQLYVAKKTGSSVKCNRIWRDDVTHVDSAAGKYLGQIRRHKTHSAVIPGWTWVYVASDLRGGTLYEGIDLDKCIESYAKKGGA